MKTDQSICLILIITFAHIFTYRPGHCGQEMHHLQNGNRISLIKAETHWVLSSHQRDGDAIWSQVLQGTGRSDLLVTGELILCSGPKMNESGYHIQVFDLSSGLLMGHFSIFGLPGFKTVRLVDGLLEIRATRGLTSVSMILDPRSESGTTSYWLDGLNITMQFHKSYSFKPETSAFIEDDGSDPVDATDPGGNP